MTEPVCSTGEPHHMGPGLESMSNCRDPHCPVYIAKRSPNVTLDVATPELKCGDVVTLTCGGTRMTVAGAKIDGKVDVAWFEHTPGGAFGMGIGQTLRQASFPAAMLRRDDGGAR